MNKIKILAIGMAAVIILLMPVLNSQLIINNDTEAHLKTFGQIKTGDAQFLYFGQKITGYFLVWLAGITKASIASLFLWFNFLGLLVGGIVTMEVIERITKSKLAGIISLFLITFGTGAVIHLFWSGTIFSVIEMIILLPLTILAFYVLMEKRTIKRLVLFLGSLIMLLIFHPTFGIQTGWEVVSMVRAETGVYAGEAILSPMFLISVFIGTMNFASLIVCIILLRKASIDIKLRVIATGLVIVIAAFLILTYTGAINFAARMSMNTAIMVNLLLCIVLGVVFGMKYKNSLMMKVALIIFVLAGAVPNIIGWIGKY